MRTGSMLVLIMVEATASETIASITLTMTTKIIMTALINLMGSMMVAIVASH